MLISPPYNEYNLDGKTEVIVIDHLGGFNKNYQNVLLNQISKSTFGGQIITEYIFDNKIKNNYPTCNFLYSKDLWRKYNFIDDFLNYNIHPQIDYKNFICSFNGGAHVSRQLLSSILNNQKYFDPEYTSKNFAYNDDYITGHLKNLDLSDSEIVLYLKFFTNNDEFNNSVYSFGHIRYEHNKNIYNLEHKLTQSFLHIVSETMATSYYPFVTEKFLFSVVTRGLFVAYAQPGWHAHLEKYYGFKLYDKIFDYSFDSIQNPVKRLIKLIEMISKFSKLSVDDWRDLYFVLEKDTIEYNYNHYFSGDYIKWLKEYE